MINIQDLHIEREILPLFNYTLNEYTKKALTGLLKEPLHSIEEILLRQDIIKGFIANNNILKSFSYSRTDFMEVYSFIESLAGSTASKKRQRFQLLFSEKERQQRTGKFIQLVSLFHKLHTFYLARLNSETFPESYKRRLMHINDFLSDLHVKKYELLIREQNFKTSHIIELTELLAVKTKNGQTSSFWENYFLFEVYLSISFGIIKQGFTFPAFSETFSLHDFYHPLLQKPVVNSFSTTCNVILLTGPNMSGKSTFLKAIGLCIYLGHLGIGIPVSKAEMPFFHSISVFINLHDDMVSGYSHFMTEVMNLKKVLTVAATGATCFAVFDELFRGTNIEDAADISITTLKGLTKRKNSIFFVSTHLHHLKEMEEVKTGKIATYFIDCELNGNIPVFTYKLKEGWSDVKLGKILFEREGLNKLLG